MVPAHHGVFTMEKELHLLNLVSPLDQGKGKCFDLFNPPSLSFDEAHERLRHPYCENIDYTENPREPKIND